MNEKNNKNYNLSLRDLVSESLLRDLILFAFLFVLTITQGWDNIFLLLFPMITFAISLFFRILSTNKNRTQFERSRVIYNPLGSEGKMANRLFFAAQFQLILIFWLGAESLYNPHLGNTYYSYFLGILIFSYTFAFFWIFLDCWKDTRVEIVTSAFGDQEDSQTSSDSRKIISFLKLTNYRLISIITFLVFIILNIINLISIFLINLNPSVGMQLFLPGSQIITLSNILYGILFISPTLTIMVLIFNYKTINNFSKEKIEKVIEPLPRNVQIKILENLKYLNNRIKEQLKSE
jgi:hypothetical protein